MNKAQLESIDATIRKTNADTALVTNSASNAAMNNQLLRASLPAALNNAGVDNSTTGKALNWINRVSASLQGTAGAVNSAKSAVTNQNHFLLDSHIDLNCVRPMPIYSVPGLVRF